MEKPIISPQAQPQSKRLITPFGVVIALAAVVLAAALAWTVYDRSQNDLAGGGAPDFSLPLLGQEGSFTLSAQRGKVVVINFWGSWCAPCRVETPLLQRTYADYQDQGVIFVGIAVDDSEKGALGFVDEFGITYPIVMDTNRAVENAYHLLGVPETFVIGKDGDFVQHFLAQPAEAELREAIEKALKE